jgi:plasmid stabilization system protein ParE
MMHQPLVLEPEAEADLLEAFEWYEKQREGLGREFFECVDDALERVANNPGTYAISHRGVRQALVRRFPYVICFLIEPERIAVIAVLHVRRNPRLWQTRLK